MFKIFSTEGTQSQILSVLFPPFGRDLHRDSEKRKVMTCFSASGCKRTGSMLLFFRFGGAMLGFFLRWSMNLLALMLAAALVSGIRVESIQMAAIAAGILGIINAVIRPIVLILTLPINLLTLGLFTLVINAAMLQLVSMVVPGLIIDGFRAAFLGAFLISFIIWILNLFVAGDGKVVFIKRVGKNGESK